MNLRDLPDVIAAAVERGFVARLPPTIPEHGQRLLAALGVPVIFEQDAPMPPLLRQRRRRGGRIGDAILELLADGREHTTREVLAAVPFERSSVGRELGLLVRDGRIRRVRRGVYVSASDRPGTIPAGKG
ncbi:MAG TPA: hypothetical protein VF731_01780, partial [Solirubrobacterales bacterium]